VHYVSCVSKETARACVARLRLDKSLHTNTHTHTHKHTHTQAPDRADQACVVTAA